MKLFTLTVLSFLTISTAFSQEPDNVVSGKDLKKTEKPKGEVKISSEEKTIPPTDKQSEVGTYPMKVSVGTPKKTSQKSNQRYTRTLADIEREIKTIETKMEVVQNDPQEDAIAKKEGWYDKMNARLEYLQAERNKHLNKK